MVEHVSYAPKGEPNFGAPGSAQGSQAIQGHGLCWYGACYYYAAMVQDNITATGASVSFTQAQPTVDSKDYHSLTELAIESANHQQIVEIGWIVAPSANGDSLPHLFVYHWVNGHQTCYNGCGFVPLSTTYSAGGLVKVGAVGTYGIQYTNSEWLLSYNGSALGYFPESIWGGTFSELGEVQVFGEVASPSATAPETQMGNGKLGTAAKSAVISRLTYTGRLTPHTLSYGAPQAPGIYTMGKYNAACETSCGMSFGGPGYPVSANPYLNMATPTVQGTMARFPVPFSQRLPPL